METGCHLSQRGPIQPGEGGGSRPFAAFSNPGLSPICKFEPLSSRPQAWQPDFALVVQNGQKWGRNGSEMGRPPPDFFLIKSINFLHHHLLIFFCSFDLVHPVGAGRFPRWGFHFPASEGILGLLSDDIFLGTFKGEMTNNISLVHRASFGIPPV